MAPKSLSLAVGTVHTLASPLVRSIDGLEYVRAASPCIVAANHSSFLDGAVLATEFIWRLGRPFHMIAYEEPFRHPVLGWFLRSARVIPFGKGDAESRAEMVRIAAEVLRGGESVGLFPEAHLNGRPILRHPRPGVAFLALLTGCPVVPVGIRGSGRILPPGSWRIRPARTIEIEAGRPLRFHVEAEQYAQAHPAERRVIVRRVLARIMTRIGALAEKRFVVRGRGRSGRRRGDG